MDASTRAQCVDASSKPDLSAIIPAFNEQSRIGQLITALRSSTQPLTIEIIVVDNGSRDRTVEVAREAGADFVLHQEGTVAAVRNAGARRASADVFLFMDADVMPTPAWAQRIAGVVEQVRRQPHTLTGSWVCVPDECTWIEKHWFEPLEKGGSSHINSGHMISSAALFRELGGFDDRLRTGEDFDISVRARAAGAVLVDDVSLKVVHYGYPKSIGEFFRREVWHGIGDWQSLSAFTSSPIAVAGAALLHAQVIGTVLTLATRNVAWIGLAIAFGIGVSALASYRRYRNVGWKTRALTIPLYFVYFAARGLSPYALLFRSWRRTREPQVAS